MESIFSRCHNYMYSHRLIKSKIFVNECNKQIYTAPNSLIVHGVLHYDYWKAERKGEKEKYIYIYVYE